MLSVARPGCQQTRTRLEQWLVPTTRKLKTYCTLFLSGPIRHRQVTGSLSPSLALGALTASRSQSGSHWPAAATLFVDTALTDSRKNLIPLRHIKKKHIYTCTHTYIHIDCHLGCWSHPTVASPPTSRPMPHHPKYSSRRMAIGGGCSL